MKVSSLKTQEPLSPEPIMEKRLGNSLVPAVDQISSSFMKSTPNMLPFIGLCFTVLNLGRLSLHPQTRGLGPSALRWIKEEHCWSCSMKLDRTGQITDLESLVKLSKELIENGDIEEVFQSLCVYQNYYDSLSESNCKFSIKIYKTKL